MFSLNFSDKKKLKSKRKIAGLEPRISCVRLSDFSDSLNSLNSLNSMKVLFHLEKTPMFLRSLQFYSPAPALADLTPY